MKPLRRFLDRIEELFSDDEDQNAPGYDPVHVGGAVVVTIAAIGALYWLLWTLLVYEGGIFLKAWAAGKVLFTPKTMADFGYEGYPYELGAFEGWIGNLAALGLCALIIEGLRRLHRDASRKSRS